MPICLDCGVEIPDMATSCQNCGLLILWEIEDENAQETQPQYYRQLPIMRPPIGKSRLILKVGAIITVIFVIAAAIFLWLFFYGPGEISGINLALDTNNPHNLGVTVLVSSRSPGPLGGQANLRITYQDRRVFSSEVIIDDDGNGAVSIPYTSFVEGNGDYTIIASYGGLESAPVEHSIGYIVERLDFNVIVYIIDGDGQLDLNIFMLYENGNTMIPRDARLTVNEIKLIDDHSYITPGESPQTISESYFSTEYPYNKSGNYSVNVTLENTRINPDSDSPYVTITAIWEGFLNIIPRANAVIVNISSIPNSSNYSVDFDASSSWNDGNITKYIWDFNGNGTIDLETTVPNATFSEYVQGQDYWALLNVEGDVIEPLTGEVEKGANMVFVASP